MSKRSGLWRDTLPLRMKNAIKDWRTSARAMRCLHNVDLELADWQNQEDGASGLHRLTREEERKSGT